MGIILNIDTSSEVCSACIAENGHILVENNELSGNQHASRLAGIISGLFDDIGMTVNDISAIALSGGPGSYTGLRIGASVAKGLCYGLDRPLMSVPTLRSLAAQMSTLCPDPDGIYIPMIDARRDDVFMAIYDFDNNLIRKDTFATVNSEFLDNLTCYNVKNIYFGGSGSSKVRKIASGEKFGTVIENVICLATNINMISYKFFDEKIFSDISQYEPFYLKDFEGRMKFK